MAKIGKVEKGQFTHYRESNLVQMNLANKQNRPYLALGEADNDTYSFVTMPSVATVKLQLTTPKGDEDGWKQGIRLLYQQIRTANTGRINYTAADLEKYVQSVRALHAINAWLQKLYRLTYTYMSTNNAVPYAMIEAMHCNVDEIIANSADLLMYCQRYDQQVRKNFPLKLDYYDYTRYLFGNVFSDSDKEKPSYYVTDIACVNYRGEEGQNGGVYYYHRNAEGNAWVGEVTFLTREPGGGTYRDLWTYGDLVQECERIKNSMINDPIYAIISGEIIKAFGDKAFMDPITTDIKDQIEVVFDESFLSMLQNANVLSFTSADPKNFSTKPELACGYLENASGGWIGDSNELVLHMNRQGSTQGSVNLTDRITGMLNNRQDNYLVNWYRSNITPSDIMFITRWIPTATQHSQGENDSITYLRFGTEVVVEVSAAFKYAEGDTTAPLLPQNYAWNSIAGNIWIYDEAPDNASPDGSELGRLAMLWANFYCAPRYRIIVIIDDTPVPYGRSISPDILGWDVFSDIKADALGNYYSYAHQSLLYAGPSQNQSNRKVYEQGPKPNRSKGKGKHNEKFDEQQPSRS